MVEAFDELPELDEGVGLLAGAAAGDDGGDGVLGDDAGAGLRDAEPVDGAGSAVEASVFSVAWGFFDRLFFVALVPVPVGAAAGCAASELSFFLVRLFFVVLVSAAAAPVESALVLFLDRLSSLVVAESLEAAASPLAVVFFLDLDLGFASSAAESVLLGDVAALFFVLFFLVVVLLSLWSVGVVDPACCVARTVALPESSNADAKIAKSTPLLDLIRSLPPLQYA